MIARALIAIAFLTVFATASHAAPVDPAIDVLPDDKPFKEVEGDAVEVPPVKPIVLDVIDPLPVLHPDMADDGTSVIYYNMLPGDNNNGPVCDTPEPASWLLLATAGAIGLYNRRRAKPAA